MFEILRFLTCRLFDKCQSFVYNKKILKEIKVGFLIIISLLRRKSLGNGWILWQFHEKAQIIWQKTPCLHLFIFEIADIDKILVFTLKCDNFDVCSTHNYLFRNEFSQFEFQQSDDILFQKVSLQWTQIGPLNGRLIDPKDFKANPKQTPNGP